MTHLIKPWLIPDCVHAVQTTQYFTGIQGTFDVHPQQANADEMEKLKQHFNMPHIPRFLKQVHEATVIEYHEPPSSDFTRHADACFTRRPDIVCAVMSADCLPVLLTDTLGTFVAAVHCGWRSLYAEILSHTIEAINPSHQILAWFGPCIQQAQYEVDETFVRNYLDKHSDCETAFTPIIKGKSHANLYQLALLQMQKISDCQISFANECTYLDDRYYSWRKDQTTQRMASLIWLDSI